MSPHHYPVIHVCLNCRNPQPTAGHSSVAASVQKTCPHIVRVGNIWGQKCSFKQSVSLLICFLLQETLRALCCKVSASCLPLFLTHMFFSPFLSLLFPTTCSACDTLCSPRTEDNIWSSPPLLVSRCQFESQAAPLAAVSHNAVPQPKVNVKHGKWSLNIATFKCLFPGAAPFIITGQTLSRGWEGTDQTRRSRFVCLFSQFYW